MPRQPKPWYREGRGWYVQLDGRQTFLGEHPPKFPRPKKNDQGEWTPPPPIRDEFHRRMAASADRPRRQPAGRRDESLLVCEVFDTFLSWLSARVAEGSKSQRTYDWYRKYLQSFLRSAPPLLAIEDLDHSHVHGWVDSHPDWKTGKRGAMTAVQRALNWAARAGLLKSLGGKSPLAGLEKPAQGRREQLVTPEEYVEVTALVKDQNFRDLLVAAWETGARPHELFTVEASFVDLDNGRWVFPVRLSKGRKAQRVVYLTDAVLEVTKRLRQRHPQGPLFRNTDGNPWCVSSVKCRFQKLRLALGGRRLQRLGLLPPKIPRLTKPQREDRAVRAEYTRKVLERRERINELAREHGTRYNLYAFRHSRITEALVAGLDAVTVSVLAGHRDTTMISRHYAHLTQQLAHLREAASPDCAPCFFPGR